MNNRVTLTGKLLEDPKTRTLELRGATSEIVSLWLEVPSGERNDRFTVEIFCPSAQQAAKALRKGVLAEITGVLRHDRWKDRATSRWVGKVFVAIDPAEGKIRSLGMADTQNEPA
ncbi:MAG TPA: single-stranded DNA-binding protein [Terricaulis sp.]|nr:single-stranded DNA-binding protein [Terricaulis sp.]